jgi:hypothetical protein
MLLHIGGFETVMLPRLLELLQQKGFALTTLEEAESDKAYEAAPDQQNKWDGTLLEQMRPAPPPAAGQDNVFTKLGTICRAAG